MKYYKYQDDESFIGSSIRYVESDEKGWAKREVNFNGKIYFASNVSDPKWGLCLSDQAEDYDSLDELTPITKQEFDDVWLAHLVKHREIWDSVKIKFPIGSAVTGYLQIFYPQGVIVNLGDNALGVADYQACKASTQPEFMYPRHKITAMVKGYDEDYQWIILESPQVHQETIIISK